MKKERKKRKFTEDRKREKEWLSEGKTQKRENPNELKWIK